MKKFELGIPPLVTTFLFGTIIWIIPNPYKYDGSSLLVMSSSLLLIVGITISVWGVLDFKKMKTTVNPMTPQESNNLVVEGIYKHTRNPMYLGFLLWLISFGVYLGNFLSIVPIITFTLYINRFHIVPEEKILLEKFGEKYSEYLKNVRRWI